MMYRYDQHMTKIAEGYKEDRGLNHINKLIYIKKIKYIDSCYHLTTGNTFFTKQSIMKIPVWLS